MYKQYSVGIVVPVWNELPKVKSVVERLRKIDYADLIVFVDDASTDGSYEYLSQLPDKNILSIRQPRQMGVGSAVRSGYKILLEKNLDIFVVMAGNDKDRPNEISRLLDKIIDVDFDFVQGSRYLKGGVSGNTPWIRRIATIWIYPAIFWLLTGKKITDVTNGFRAVKSSMIKKLWQQLNQDWLNTYELELYLIYQAVAMRFKFTEVPVTKIYPDYNLGYTKMRMFIDWWKILRAPILVRLKIKK